MVMTDVSTGRGPAPAPSWSNIALVPSGDIFFYWTRSMCIICSVFFLFISYKPHFTSATEKESS